MLPHLESLSWMMRDMLKPSNSVGGYEFDLLPLLTVEEHLWVSCLEGKED